MTNSFTPLTDAQRYRLGVNYQTIPVRDAVPPPFENSLKLTPFLIFRLIAPWPLSVCFISVTLKYYFFAHRWGFIRPSANFQRDGRAVHDDNQGSRPNYPSTLEKLNLPPRAYNDANHTIWVCSPRLPFVVELVTD